MIPIPIVIHTVNWTKISTDLTSCIVIVAMMYFTAKVMNNL